MSVMASQITGVSVVCRPFVVAQIKENFKAPKLRVTGLCKGNLPLTGGFPLQRASNAEEVPFDNVIMWIYALCEFKIWQISDICQRRTLCNAPPCYNGTTRFWNRYRSYDYIKCINHIGVLIYVFWIEVSRSHNMIGTAVNVRLGCTVSCFCYH